MCCGYVFLFGTLSCLNMAGLQQETSLTFLLVHRSRRVGILDCFGNDKDTGGRQSIPCAVCGKELKLRATFPDTQVVIALKDY